MILPKHHIYFLLTVSKPQNKFFNFSCCVTLHHKQIKSEAFLQVFQGARTLSASVQALLSPPCLAMKSSKAFSFLYFLLPMNTTADRQADTKLLNMFLFWQYFSTAMKFQLWQVFHTTVSCLNTLVFGFFAEKTEKESGGEKERGREREREREREKRERERGRRETKRQRERQTEREREREREGGRERETDRQTDREGGRGDRSWVALAGTNARGLEMKTVL